MIVADLRVPELRCGATSGREYPGQGASAPYLARRKLRHPWAHTGGRFGRVFLPARALLLVRREFFQGKLCRRLFIPTMPTHKAMAAVTRDSKDSAISTIQVETDLAAESGKANHD